MTSSRLARSLCALSVVSIFALPGCYKGDDQVNLQKDGSGTLVQTATIDTEKLNQLKSTVELFAGQLSGGNAAGADPSNEISVKVDEYFTADDVKARLKGVEGIELKKVDRTEKDGKASVRIEVAYKTLEAAAKAGMFSIFSVDLVKNADGSYTLKFDVSFGMGDDAPAAPTPPTPPTPPAPGMDGPKPAGETPPPVAPPGMDLSGVLGMLEPIVGEMEMKRTLTLPGTITETNGTQKVVEGGTAVTWTVGFRDLTSGKKLTQSATFKGEGLELKPFSYKPNFGGMLKRYLNYGGDDGADTKPPPPPAVTPTTPDTGMDPK